MSKELVKQHGSIERILRKVDKDLNLKEPLTNNELKALYLHYYTHIYKMDMIRTSRGLSCVDNSKVEDMESEALDYNKELNNKNDDGFVEQDSIVLTNQMLYQHLKRREISPYSGVLPDGKEKEVILDLIAKNRALKERTRLLVMQALE
jgi:PBP1b-binding outer membrane lipoprotein LpoB